MTARSDIEKFEDPEFLPENDPTFFTDSGLTPELYSIETDDNLKLAALYFRPDSTAFDSIRGTAVLLHHGDSDRTFLMSYIRPLLDSGLAVLIYDQRACGFSPGSYHYAGLYEAEDLVQVIVYLNLHDLLIHPLIVAGFEIGADAAIYASQKEPRIDYIVAVEPYLTTDRWINNLKKSYGALTIPFYKMIYYWWYQKRTNFQYDRTFTEDIKPVGDKTLLIMSQSGLDSEEALKLKEISGEKLAISVRPEQFEAIEKMVLTSIYSQLK